MKSLEKLHNSVRRGHSWVVRLPFEKACRDILAVNLDGTVALSALVTDPQGAGMVLHYGTLLCSKVLDITRKDLDGTRVSHACTSGASSPCEDDIEAWFPRY